MASNERSISYDLKYYQSNLEPNIEMAISIQDQQTVFLAYRALFEGQNSQIRKDKAIRKALKKGKTSASTIKRLGEEKVVSVLKILLERGIFASELKAKLAFPTLYKTSPEQDARREVSDAGAAREEAEALQEVEALDSIPVDAEAGVPELDDGDSDEEEEQPVDPRHAKVEKTGKQGKAVVHVSNFVVLIKWEGTAQQSSPSVPSLYPVLFPFRVQHVILTRSQKLLEECCYDFTQQWMPSLLADKKWECAEAIELNKWAYTISKRHGKFPDGAFKKSSTNLAESLLAVNKLRHSSVHRLHTSAKGIIQMLDAAVKFAETLSDVARATQLEELSKEVKSKVKSQELNKNYLETKIKNELEEIDRQRRELAKREQQAIASMSAEDEDNTRFIGALLEDRLQAIMDGDSSNDQLNEPDFCKEAGDAHSDVMDEDPCDKRSKEPDSPNATAGGAQSGNENEVWATPRQRRDSELHLANGLQ